MMPSPLPPSEEVVLCDARRESNALQADTVPTNIHAVLPVRRRVATEVRFPDQSTPFRSSLDPCSTRYTPRCPSVVLWTPCSGCVCSNFELRTDNQFGEAARRAKPANLVVEAAEESLSILPNYTPTVRPPPKRC
jgi:hypothetical protein